VTRFVGALSIVLACTNGCAAGGRDDPRDLVRAEQPPAKAGAGGTEITPPAGSETPCGQFCGQTFLHEVDNPPNLYFLVDRSSSMEAPIGNQSKYRAARKVLGELLTVIGHRVRFGASIFPLKTDDTCSPGFEIFPPALGGLPACDGSLDPTLASFLSAFGSYAPGGQTPTYAALSKLRPELEGLDGDTDLVLITDGAPNCSSDDTSCGADWCLPNIEGYAYGQTSCSPDFNCCDPANTGARAGENCVDAERTAAEIARLAARHIPTYVVGMPGAEPYASVLNLFAEAGGTARKGAVEYYAVTDEDDLQAAIYAIGTGVAIRCSIELDAAPDDPSQVNVYFDGELVPADPEDGWSWQDATTIQVNGAACDRLTSGDVIDARAVFGCDTVVR
jgi:hypothetical protein